MRYKIRYSIIRLVQERYICYKRFYYYLIVNYLKYACKLRAYVVNYNYNKKLHGGNQNEKKMEKADIIKELARIDAELCSNKNLTPEQRRKLRKKSEALDKKLYK